MEQTRFKKQKKLKVIFVSVESGITALGFRKIAALSQKLNPDTEICFIPVDNLYAVLSHIFPTKKIDFDDKDVKIAAKYLARSDLVCFSSMTASAAYVEKIAQAIKKENPATFLLWGGVHAIIHPQEAIKWVDAICTGEGEIPFQTFFQAYCNGKNYLATPGMWFKIKKGIRKNHNLPLNSSQLLGSFPFLYIGLDCQIYDLNKRKFRAFTKFDYVQYHGLTYRTVWSLGCPYSCIYCANDAFISLDRNYRRIRYAPVEHMIGEIENALNLHPYVTTIAFYDDNFIAIPPEDIKEFARMYKKRIKLPFVVFGLHPNIITKEKIKILAKAGMNRGRMGIQSGSKRTLSFYNRPTPLPTIKQSVKILARAAKKYQMIPPSYDIISDNPVEIRKDIVNNLKFLYRLERPYTLTVFSLRVFPKTKLWEYFNHHPEIDIRDKDSSYLDTRKTMDNILLYLLAAFKPPKFIFNRLLKSVRGYQEKQKSYPVFHLLAKIVYLFSRGIQHLVKLDFTVVVGWWVYYIWKIIKMLPINKKQGHLSSILVITLLWFVYFYKFFLFQNTLYLGDSFAFDLHHRVFLINQLKNGEIPLWNPLILNGIPFLLIASHGFLNPSTLLFFVFTPEIAMTLATVLNILLSGILMYFFTYLLTKKSRSAFFAGIVYMFCGLSAIATTTIIIIQELPLVPLAFICIHLLAVKKQKLYLLLTSLVLGLQFISGFPLVPYLTALGITIYYFFLSRQSPLKRFFSILLIGLFSIGLSAFLLLPQLEVAKYSTRPPADYTYATSASLHPFSLVTFFLPHFFGIGEVEMSFNTHNKTYLGLIPLLITAFMIIYQRRLLNKGLLSLTILGFLLSFGRYFPLYKLALLVPGLSNFREPEFFLIWYVFGASYISGVGLNTLLLFESRRYRRDRELPIKSSLLIKIFSLVFICLSAVFLYLKVAPPAFWQDLITFIQRVIFPGKSLTTLLLKAGKIQQLIFLNLSNTLFALLLFLVAFALLKKIKNKKLLFISLVLITFLDLFFLNQSELFFLDKITYQKIFTPQKVPAVIKNNNVRIHSIANYLAPSWTNFSREKHLQQQIFRDTNTFWPNRNLSYDIASIDGFSPLVFKTYVSYLSSEPQKHLSGFTSYDVSSTNENLAKVGANFIVSDKLMEEFKPPRYLLLAENPPSYYMYQDTTARKRAFLVNQEGKEVGQANIISSRANSVTISTESSENASLVLLDTYYPGWEAYVDKQQVEITPFENTFRQITLKSGKHTAEFIFNPKSLKYGSLITLLTFVTFIIIVSL